MRKSHWHSERQVRSVARNLIDMDGAYIPETAVVEDFLTFISDSDFSVCSDFRESWEYIKAERRSLERHTNLGICFKTMKDY